MTQQQKPRMIRQGDVMLQQCDHLPPRAKRVKRDKGRVILAYGEVTGHAHAITDRSVALLEHEGQRFLHAPNGAELKHEEHSDLQIPPGKYRVVHQREYTPEAIVPVAD